MPRTGLSQEELRLAILDAVEANVRRYGIEKTRLVDVARSLGVSHTALYKLFPDKQALMDTVSNRWLEHMEAELQQIAARKAKAKAKLRQWFVRLHRLKREKVMADPELYAAFDMAAASARPFIQRHKRVVMEQLEQMVQQGMASGELRVDDPKATAQTLFTATLAFHHPRLVLDNIQTDQVPQLEQLLDVLLAGISHS